MLYRFSICRFLLLIVLHWRYFFATHVRKTHTHTMTKCQPISLVGRLSCVKRKSLLFSLTTVVGWDSNRFNSLQDHCFLIGHHISCESILHWTELFHIISLFLFSVFCNSIYMAIFKRKNTHRDYAHSARFCLMLSRDKIISNQFRTM